MNKPAIPSWRLSTPANPALPSNYRSSVDTDVRHTFAKFKSTPRAIQTLKEIK